MHRTLTAAFGLVVITAVQAGTQSPPLRPDPSSRQTTAPSPEIFPGALLDEEETRALTDDGSRVQVYRTSSDFDVVVNYYRFKRKQPVHLVVEDVGAKFRRVADLVEKAEPPPALLADPFVRRFHQVALGTTSPSRDAATLAWRTYADKFERKQQRIGEGTRVTVYRPYLSPRTFTLIDETVIVLRRSGGKDTW